MNGNIKRYIYIIVTICIVFLVGVIFIRILPGLLLAGFIAYIVMKIVGFVKGKKQQKDSNKINFNNKNDNVDNFKDSEDDYMSGEVIDVDYEEIDKNKK